LGPSIKYVTLLLTNFDPLPPLSHFGTHLGTPHKVHHTSRNPRKILLIARLHYTLLNFVNSALPNCSCFVFYWNKLLKLKTNKKIIYKTLASLLDCIKFIKL